MIKDPPPKAQVSYQLKLLLTEDLLQPVLFQNYGALLRDLGEVVQAESLYKQGLKLFPDHRGIRLNYANLIRTDEPVKSFNLHFGLLQEKVVKTPDEVTALDVYPVVDILESLQCYHWAYQICRWGIVAIEAHPSLLLQLFKILSNK